MLTTQFDKTTERFDVVCHFEVLEHIFDTDNFIKENIGLLNQNGKIIIGTPDPEGIGSIISKNILNLPPHHQLEFSQKTFEWIAEK